MKVPKRKRDNIMARKYDITKSIESTTITFKEFDLSKGGLIDSTEEIKDFDNTMTDDKIITLLRNKYNHVNALQVINKQTTNAYYGMTKDVFVAHAKPTNNKDGRNLIKRTLNAYNIEYRYYDMNDGSLKIGNAFLDKVNEDDLFTLKGVNIVRKQCESDDVRITNIVNWETVSEMYGMTVSDFIKYGTIIESSEMNADENENE